MFQSVLLFVALFCTAVNSVYSLFTDIVSKNNTLFSTQIVQCYGIYWYMAVGFCFLFFVFVQNPQQLQFSVGCSLATS